MSWQESNIMDERLKFVGRLLDGGKMSPVQSVTYLSGRTPGLRLAQPGEEQIGRRLCGVA